MIAADRRRQNVAVEMAKDTAKKRGKLPLLIYHKATTPYNYQLKTIIQLYHYIRLFQKYVIHLLHLNHQYQMYLL